MAQELSRRVGQHGEDGAGERDVFRMQFTAAWKAGTSGQAVPGPKARRALCGQRLRSYGLRRAANRQPPTAYRLPPTGLDAPCSARRKAEPHDPAHAHAPRHEAAGSELTLKPLVLTQCWPATDHQETDDVGHHISANMHGTTRSLPMKRLTQPRPNLLSALVVWNPDKPS